jgi:hypothetical protein
MEYYVLTGQAKMHAVSDHITETYFDPEQSNFEKIIVFAHHQNVLDTICMALVKKVVLLALM